MTSQMTTSLSQMVAADCAVQAALWTQEAPTCCKGPVAPTPNQGLPTHMVKIALSLPMSVGALEGADERLKLQAAIAAAAGSVSVANVTIDSVNGRPAVGGR